MPDREGFMEGCALGQEDGCNVGKSDIEVFSEGQLFRAALTEGCLDGTEDGQSVADSASLGREDGWLLGRPDGPNEGRLDSIDDGRPNALGVSLGCDISLWESKEVFEGTYPARLPRGAPRFAWRGTRRFNGTVADVVAAEFGALLIYRVGIPSSIAEASPLGHRPPSAFVRGRSRQRSLRWMRALGRRAGRTVGRHGGCGRLRGWLLDDGQDQCQRFASAFL